jgi:DNA primase
MSLLDYRAIRDQISIRRVLDLINYETVARKGAQWRGPCPLCCEASRAKARCFSVHVSYNVFRCFRCGRSGNQLDLWRHHSGLPIYEAALDLCEQLNITPPQTKNPQLRNGY